MASQGNKRLWEALRAAEVGIGKDPTSAYAHGVLGHVLYRLGKKRAALKALDEALRHNVYYTFAYDLKSSIYCEQKKRRLAIETAEAGLAVDPNNSDLLARKAWALMEQGRHQEAKATIDAGLAQSPGHSTLLNTLGCMAMTTAQNTPGLLLFQPLRRARIFRQAHDLFTESLRIEPTERPYAENRYHNMLSARRHCFLSLLCAGAIALLITTILWTSIVETASDRLAATLSAVLLLGALGLGFAWMILSHLPELLNVLPLGWLGFPRVKYPPPVSLERTEPAAQYAFDPDDARPVARRTFREYDDEKSDVTMPTWAWVLFVIIALRLLVTCGGK